MKKSAKNIITVLAVTAIVGLIIVRLVANKHTIDKRTENAIQQQIFDIIPVKTYIVKKISLSSQMSQSGTFAPQQELKLMAQAQGQIKTLLVKKAQFVYKGTLLATSDNTALVSQLSTSRAALAKAQQDAQRMKNALASGGVTQQQVENAELQVQNAQTTLKQLEQQSANYKIIAPINGVVNDVFAEQGSFVSPGTPIMEIVDISEVILTISMNQEMLPKIKPGQKVKVRSEVYPDFVFDGKIETINAKTDASQKIEVGILVPNSQEHPIIAGMFGQAEIKSDPGDSGNAILAIPRAALVGSIQNAKVYVVTADSTVTLRSIVAGQLLDNNIEVVSGLKEGEQVVTAGQFNLEEGKKITIKN